MGYALFNSFPDYSTLESWEGSLKGMANFCCSGKHLEASTESGRCAGCNVSAADLSGDVQAPAGKRPKGGAAGPPTPPTLPTLKGM